MDNDIVLTFDESRLKIKTGSFLGTKQLKKFWHDLHTVLSSKNVKSIEVDTSMLTDIDNSGAALLVYMENTSAKKGIEFCFNGLSDDISETLNSFRVNLAKPEKINHIRSFVEDLGRGSMGLFESFESDVGFVGKLASSFFRLFRNPGELRWKDTLIVSELAGVNSFWICSTIGVLFGLILAFQSAMPMKQFGAEIYVASLVSMSLFRVLGPFIAAILFAARSGSAFAAEIGTMKVNEEIDALITMGLDPVSFLTLPRVISGVIFVPLLTAVVNLFGLIGMFGVMFSLGYPFATIYQQVINFTTLTDMTGGLCKALVFGLLVAGVGCLRGLQTTTGSQAVGQAATKAVVSGIVLVVVAEGIFSVIFYVLGI
ncbi:MAG: ABC transporter permease [Sedimentisphaeraceae bacterium JB056]